MTRVPVTIKRSRMRFMPQRFVAWVPRQRVIVVRTGARADRYLLAHELRHVMQAEGRPWPLVYIAQWVRHAFRYDRMPFERQARRAESDPAYLAWADDLLEGNA